MKAVLVPVGKMPEVVELDDGNLRSMQVAVGGCIEPCSWVFNDEPAVYVNDEGKFACEPNRAVYATEADEGCVRWDGTTVHEGDLLDILFGDVLCVGLDPETGESRDVTDEEAQRVMDRFGSDESIESGGLEFIRTMLRSRAVG